MNLRCNILELFCHLVVLHTNCNLSKWGYLYLSTFSDLTLTTLFCLMERLCMERRKVPYYPILISLLTYFFNCVLLPIPFMFFVEEHEDMFSTSNYSYMRVPSCKLFSLLGLYCCIISGKIIDMAQIWKEKIQHLYQMFSLCSIHMTISFSKGLNLLLD